MSSTPIASELSFLVWQKQQQERDKPVVSPANRDKFPVQPPKQARPAWFSDAQMRGPR